MAVLYSYIYYFYIQICYFIKFIISLCQDFLIMGIRMGGTANRTWLTIGVVVAITIALELVVGNVPSDIFRFPLNVVILALWLVVLYSLYKRRSTSTCAKFMLSTSATWLSLGLVAALGIVLGLQVEPMSESWPAVVAILFILSHLSLVIMRGWRIGRNIRWRFSIMHIGLWLALVAGFFGAPDREQLRLLAIQGIPTDEAYDMSGAMNRLDYSITLTGFDADYYDNGVPSTYRATIAIEDEAHTIEVNKPYDYSWRETIYLISHGTQPSSNMHETSSAQYCIFEVVNEPWQWLSTIGLVMLIGGAILLFIGGPRKSQSIEKLNR